MRKLWRNSSAAEAVTWAQHLVQRSDWVVLDTETTGLDQDAEPVEIAVINHAGETIFNQLVRPIRNLIGIATKIHRIELATLQAAPPFREAYPNFQAVLTGKLVLAYNAEFDRRVIEHACHLANLPLCDCSWDCAMERYRQWRGFVTNLAVACQIEGIVLHGHHRALIDAALVRNLLLKMTSVSERSNFKSP